MKKYRAEQQIYNTETDKVSTTKLGYHWLSGYVETVFLEEYQPYHYNENKDYYECLIYTYDLSDYNLDDIKDYANINLSQIKLTQTSDIIPATEFRNMKDTETSNNENLIIITKRQINRDDYKNKLLFYITDILIILIELIIWDLIEVKKEVTNNNFSSNIDIAKNIKNLKINLTKIQQELQNLNQEISENQKKSTIELQEKPYLQEKVRKRTPLKKF